ncbi:MAG: RNA methyltransferase [Nitrospinota bacterium]
MSNISVALIHYPITDRAGNIVTTSVTTIDLHDIARLAKTYDLDRFFVVTPNQTQKRLVQRLIGHWMDGYGAKYNPSRKVALELLNVVDSVEEIYDIYKIEGKTKPSTFVTSAKDDRDTLSFSRARIELATNLESLVMFGTGYGLARNLVESADFRLAPIAGIKDYNHLSVRVAAAILLDRLLGDFE